MCGNSKIESIDLWHRRLGHLNYRDLMKVANNEIIRGVHLENPLILFVALVKRENKLGVPIEE